jgi:hypothetical protein
MALTHPVITVTVAMPDGVEHHAFDITKAGADAAIGQALLTQLADAVVGQVYTLSVTVLDLAN